MNWTWIDDVQLAALSKINAPPWLAALILDRSERAIVQHVWRLGLPPLGRSKMWERLGFWNAERVRELEGMLRQGVGYAKAGRHFGVSRSAVSGAVSRHLQHLIRDQYRRDRCAPIGRMNDYRSAAPISLPKVTRPG